MNIRCLLLPFAAALAVAAAGCAGGSSSLPGTGVTAQHATGPAAKRKSRLGLQDQPLGPCPQGAMFLRLPGEIRGYPLGANGPTTACTDIVGPQTLLTGNGNGYGAISVSVHGDLHALAFQSNAAGGLMIFASDASGDTAPFRAVAVGQDHVALAVDSAVNDYIVASENYAGDNCWYVVPVATLAASTSNCDLNVSSIFGLAVTPQNELVVLGADATTSATRIDIFANAASATPALVRSISGPLTGLPAVNSNYFSFGYSLATDPTTGNIYVFSADATGATPPAVLQFAAAAVGNVAPYSTLSGPLTQLPSTAFAVDLLAVDTSSNLYVNATSALTAQVMISVFSPASAGNITPTRVIYDDTLLNPSGGGIAVRSAPILPVTAATAAHRATPTHI